MFPVTFRALLDATPCNSLQSSDGSRYDRWRTHYAWKGKTYEERSSTIQSILGHNYVHRVDPNELRIHWKKFERRSC
jgi:hypothetical protein